MKFTTFITVLAFVSTSAGTELTFRNLYKEPFAPVIYKQSPKIIGGSEVEPHSIPYQVFLEIYSSSEGWYCGGSLISVNYVLTAAHCGAEAIQAYVTLGAHRALDLEDTQIQAVTKDISIHKDFDSEKIVNDIGVIRLPSAIHLTDAIQLVSLPKKADVNNNFAGERANVSGWGLTNGLSTNLSPVLRVIDLNIIENDLCAYYYGELKTSILCTSGDDYSGTCSGDSGGPLVINNVQVGVVSFGVQYCLPGYPSAFTRITSFLDWLTQHTDVKIE